MHEIVTITKHKITKALEQRTGNNDVEYLELQPVDFILLIKLKKRRKNDIKGTLGRMG